MRKKEAICRLRQSQVVMKMKKDTKYSISIFLIAASIT